MELPVAQETATGKLSDEYNTQHPQDIWFHYGDIGMLNDVKPEFDIVTLDEVCETEYLVDFDDELPKAI